MKKKVNKRYVVTSSMTEVTGSATSCYDHKGVASTVRSEWKKFFTDSRAREWATLQGIEIDNIRIQIIEEEFTDWDLRND